MRFSTPVYLLALAALVAADEASDVISLTAQTFQSIVDTEPIALVEFFAPWYGLITFLNLFHFSSNRTGVDIAKLWPLTMRKLQQPSKTRTLNSPRSIVSRNLTSANHLAFRGTRTCYSFCILNVYSMALYFRTLKVYRQGVATEYHGPRKADGIISYMIK